MDLATHPHDCNNFRVAMAWAARGASVFPCRGKQPCYRVNWRSESTKDPVEIWAYWVKFPDGVPAINLGKSGKNGWFCPDCDVDGDLKGWDWLKARCPDEYKGALEAMPGSITPSGGRHPIFQNCTPPLGNGRYNLPDKTVANIDVRGDGGYIIAPGADTSGYPNGGIYRPIGDLENIPVMPVWLVEVFTPKPWVKANGHATNGHVPPPATEPIERRCAAYGESAMREIERELSGAAKGNRNNEAARLAFKAGRLVGGGCIELGAAYARLAAATLPWGISSTDKALGPSGTIMRGLQAGMLSPRGPHSGPEDDSPKIVDLNSRREGFKEETPQEADKLADKFQGFWEGEEMPGDATTYLVAGLVPRRGTGILSGQFGKGKSFVALDLCGSIMTGTEFAGRECRERGGVLYIVAEGEHSFGWRIRALTKFKLAAADEERQPFYCVPTCPNLQDKKDISRLLTTIDYAKAEMQMRFGMPLVLIVVDTLALAGSYRDEKDRSEVTRVIGALKAIGNHADAMVLGVDHFGKDEIAGTMNSSAKDQGVDVTLSIQGARAQSGQVSANKLTIWKSRIVKTGQEFPFHLETVYPYDDQALGPAARSTCIVSWKEEDNPIGEFVAKGKARRKSWPGSLLSLQKIMVDLVAGMGEPYRPWPDGPAVLAVTYEQVEAEFFRRWPNPSVEAKRKAWNRVSGHAELVTYVATRTDDGVTRWWLATSKL